jgi:tellurite resistance protein TerC
MIVLVAILVLDLVVIGRRPHEPSLRECTLWVIFYVALACLFGFGLYLFQGPRESGEFFAGWITEYSLSVDNLFIFMIIMSRFAVPRAYQQKVLLVGIVLALVMRGAFIAAGAAVIGRFSWVFYLFGAFLVYTAVRLATQRGDDGDGEFKENVLVRISRRILPLSRDYDRSRVVTHQGGRWRVTPMLIVMITIGSTDLLFALDSIPAIFGLTRYAYLVFAANVFALMGLRQLYFLIGGLLRRLVYLNVGLAVILAFIGGKLVLDAMHENALPFLNGGDAIGWAPHVPIWVSLAVIVAALGVTTVASLIKSARVARSRPVQPAGTCPPS